MSANQPHSDTPKAKAAQRRRRPRVIRRGVEREAVLGISSDERDHIEVTNTNDERLRRETPPHGAF